MNQRRLRIAIVGSRDCRDKALIAKVVRHIARKWPNATIVSGGAKGVDQIAARIARSLGLDVHEHLPDWDEHGRAAGFERNTTIVDDVHFTVAIWNGHSRGTADTCRKTIGQGKALFIYLTTTRQWVTGVQEQRHLLDRVFAPAVWQAEEERRAKATTGRNPGALARALSAKRQ